MGEPGVSVRDIPMYRIYARIFGRKVVHMDPLADTFGSALQLVSF